MISLLKVLSKFQPTFLLLYSLLQSNSIVEIKKSYSVNLFKSLNKIDTMFLRILGVFPWPSLKASNMYSGKFGKRYINDQHMVGCCASLVVAMLVQSWLAVSLIVVDEQGLHVEAEDCSSDSEDRTLLMSSSGNEINVSNANTYGRQVTCSTGTNMNLDSRHIRP